MSSYDYVLVGGGLQSGLLALALRSRRPKARVAIVEASEVLGGNHTWCYHASDVPMEATAIIEPLTVASWLTYQTRFPSQTRTVESRYSAVTSDRFDAVVREAVAACGWDLRLGSSVIEVGAGIATLESGERLTGRCVIDARGPCQTFTGCGFQKFLGLEVETQSWPDRVPVVMDATVPQTDGYHFVYTVPLAANRVLVEDTYFSDTPEFDHGAARRHVEGYLHARVGGWRVIREESGVLPMPWQDLPRDRSTRPLVGGYAGGWFHPATGYSFPVALRFALAVASVPPEEAARALAELARRMSPRWRFARFLNWLLFRLVPPGSRWQVFARLYRTLPPSVLARFYALEFSAADAARILFGRPPRIDWLRPLHRPGRKSWLLPSPGHRLSA